MKNKKVVAELKRLARIHGGLLKPEVVVAQARSPVSHLHKYFTWDDTEAAKYWRLEEARHLIRVVVEKYEGKEMHTFVSLSPDRPKNGYRLTVDVIRDPKMRNLMLQDALRELESFQRKWSDLQELSKLFKTIKGLFDKYEYQ